MANGYGGSSSSSGSSGSSSSTRQATTSTTRLAAPPGFHYMPDGTLMSDQEHERLYGAKPTMQARKTITNFNISTENLRANGESRRFTVNGTKNAVFSLFVINEDGHYYNFDTSIFSAAPSRLDNIILKTGSYRGTIRFPKITDNDHYDIYLMAEPGHDTYHTAYKEARRKDRSIDVNASTGSDSAILIKKIYQYTDLTLTMTAISPNGLTAFGGMVITNDTVTVSRGRRSGKVPFKIIATAGATRNFVLKRQPVANDLVTYVERTIGSAAIPISGEDTSSSTYYRWPIDNIVGLKEGMFVINNNTTAGTQIASYREYVKETIPESRGVDRGLSEVSSRDRGLINPLTARLGETTLPEQTVEIETDIVSVGALEATGPEVFTDGVIASQTGNIVFNLQQADALKDDDVKIYGHGPESITALTNYEIEISDLKVELTPVTTTTTSAVSNSKSVPIASRDGIRDGVSTVSGIGIKPNISGTDTVDGAVTAGTKIVMDTAVASTMRNGDVVTGAGIPLTSTVTVTALDPDGDNANEFSVSEAVTVGDGITLSFSNPSNPTPSVVSGAGAVNGAGTVVLSATQTLEDGVNLTFNNSSRIATITGNIEVKRAGNASGDLRFDLEKFITAT